MRNKVTTGSGRLSNTLGAADFLLEPSAFVQRCHQVFPSENISLDSPESKAFINSLKTGASKLDVVDAFRFLQNRALPSPLTSSYIEAGTTEHWHLLGDELVTFAPENDRLFVDLIFSYFLPAGSDEVDRLSCYAELSSGSMSRRSLINRIASLSPKSDIAWADSSDDIVGPVVMAGPVAQSVEISIDAELWQQTPPVSGSSGFTLSPGWVLASPKYNLKPGSWLAELSLWQPEGGRIILDVTAHGGLTRLLDIELCGPAALAGCFEVRPSDKLIEMRLFKPEQPEGLRRFSLGKLAIKPAHFGAA